MRFTLTSKRISGIPVLELFSEHPDKKRPLVIMIHGFTASKEYVLPYAFRLVKESFYTVLLDAYYHGERETARFKNSSHAEKKGHLFTIVFKTSKDIDSIIAAFDDNPFVDIDNVGLVGFSMGGMIVYDYVTTLRPSNVKAAVPVIATPEFGKLVKRDIARDLNLAKHFDEETISLIDRKQPSSHLAALKDFPLLILNGTADEHMPIADIRSFYERARRSYTRKDLIKFIEYEGVEHTITPEMMSQAVKWLKRHL